MVLEHLFPESWLSRKARYAFIIAVLYTSIGIIGSRFLFGANSGIVSVFFISLLFMPYFKKVIRVEEDLRSNSKKGSERELVSDTISTFKLYLFVFLGIYFTYAAYSFIMPLYGQDPTPFFREQLSIDSSLRGQAISSNAFVNILSYNWWVIFATFLIALLAGDGAIFFVAWNASTWGTIMGYRAATASIFSGANPLGFLFLVITITFPHMILEGTSYILSAMSGSVISQEVVHKTKHIRQFMTYIIVGIICFTLFYFSYINLFPFMSKLVFTLLSIILLLVILYLSGSVFSDSKHKAVFRYHYELFILAVIILMVAAIVEALVLSNSETINKIYHLSILYN